MAINPAEGNALIRCFLSAFGTDYGAMGRLVYYLRLELPAVNWPIILANLTATWQPFVDAGLSTDWWVSEVMRRADEFVPVQQ